MELILNRRIATGDRTRRRRSGESAVRIGVLAVILVGLAQAATQMVDFSFFNLRVAALNSDVHASVFGVASIAAQGAAAIAAAAYAARSPRRRAWLLLAALVAVLVVIRILVPYSTMLLVPPTAAVFGLYWWLSSTFAPELRAILRTGLLLLLFSFTVHVVGPKIVTALGYDASSWAYQVKGILKHSTELMGWMLLALAVAVTGSANAAADVTGAART
jgi:hypothetical protein